MRAARSAILNRDFCDQIHDAKSLYQEPIHRESSHQEPIQPIQEPINQESIHQGPTYRETVEPIVLASQEVQEATAPSPSIEISQSLKQRTTPWKNVEGVIVIDDD